MSHSGDNGIDEQRQHLRKRAVRQRAQKFIREDRARQLKRVKNDRLVKAKAAETRVREEIKAERRRREEEERRKLIVYIVLREDSDEDLDDRSDDDSETLKDRDWNTCLSLSCFVVLLVLLVCNLLFLQYVFSRQVKDKQ
jgi:hypothetical protein